MIIALRHLLLAGLLAASAFTQNGALGVFTSSGDVGGPAIKGSSEFKSSSGEYRITGSGANLYLLVSGDNGATTEGPLGSDSSGVPETADSYCNR